MSDHAEKARERLFRHPAPRDLSWKDFIAMWEKYADKVEQESGDRLAVDYDGHREVFRREHDGLVGIEDVERARKLFGKPESTEGAPGAPVHLFVVTVTDEDARFYDFDLEAHDVEVDQHEHVRNPDARGHHMRTVERKTGRDDDADLKRFFDELADKLREDAWGHDVVVLGHGAGKADAAAQFVERLADKHPVVRGMVKATGTIVLSAATEADLEKKAEQLAAGA